MRRRPLLDASCSTPCTPFARTPPDHDMRYEERRERNADQPVRD
jgi:hypothetical protein